VLASGCTREEYRNADLQLDILAPLPEHADQLRICVEGSRSRTVGAGGSRYALPGLPAGEPAEVVVDVLVERDGASAADTGQGMLSSIARSLRVTLSPDAPYGSTSLEIFAHSEEDIASCDACLEPCRGGATAAQDQEETWLLTARFEP
jgi:hypothetical protein